MRFTRGIVFEEALHKVGERSVVGSRLRSETWSRVPVALRERAFFSAGVEKAKFLGRMQDYLADYMAKAIDPGHGGLRAQGRAEFVADFREAAIREGLGKTGDIREDDLTDLRSLSRLQLIFDTQVEAANEYGWWKQGQDESVLDVFPAQRFIRVRPVSAPREYHAAHEGEVRRKDDLEFWLSMNRDFGVPWGPWGFNSGMGVEDVDRIEAEQLGVIGPDDRVRPVERDFNERLSASVSGMDDALRRRLADEFGGRLRVRGDEFEWGPPSFTDRSDMIREFDQWFNAQVTTNPPGRRSGWGSAMTEREVLRHAEAVAAEWHRIQLLHPSLPLGQKVFVARDSARGKAVVGGEVFVTKTRPWKQRTWDAILKTERVSGRRYAVERPQTQVEDNFRHEVGHLLYSLSVRSAWEERVMRHRSLEWFGDYVSRYAVANPREAFAETFALVTQPGFRAGSLGVEIQSFMDDLIHGRID